MSETLSGACFGLAVGFSPGPLPVLVIQQTLRYGTGEGVKVAGAPVLTDPFIIVVALVALNQFGEVQGFLGGASLLGAGVLAYLAYGSLTFDGAVHWNVAVRARSIRKGCS